MPDASLSVAGTTAMQPSQLETFGRITAGTTHELNNVLSIIEQMMGLLDDQLASGQPLGEDDVQRLNAILPRMNKQIDRGVLLLAHLNRFAHSVDRDGADGDLNELLRSLHALSLRFANQVEVELILDLPGALYLLDSSAYPLLHLLFTALGHVLACGHQGDELLLGLTGTGGTAHIQLSGNPVRAMLADDMRLSELTRLAAISELEMDADDHTALTVHVAATAMTHGLL